ncbi:MAG: zinc ribbon domain-containing protein [Iamia sp.]
MTLAFCTECGNRLRATSQFCGSCGTPVRSNDATERPESPQAAPPPPEVGPESVPSSEPVRPSRRGGVVLAAAVVVLLAVAAGGAWVVASDRGGDEQTTAPTTATGGTDGSPPTTPADTARSTTTPPESCTTPVSAVPSSVDGAGPDLVVTVTFTNSCAVPVDASEATTVRITSDGREVAAARFDLSAPALDLPARSSRDVDLRFSPGSWNARPPDADDLAVDVTLPLEEGDGADDSRLSYLSEGSLTEVGPGDALALQRDLDSGDVESDLVGFWVPQISSKRVGLEADGIVYDDAAMLSDHQGWRNRFPDARLVRSDDYSTFEAPDFWVTVVDVGFSSPESANAWCDQNGLSPNDCFAKLLSHTTGPVGSTVSR